MTIDNYNLTIDINVWHNNIIVYSKTNKLNKTCRAGTYYPSGAPESTIGF
jgi:hypothetical protein